MNLLDDIRRIKELDKSSVLESIELLPDQMRQAWDEVSGIKIPSDFARVKNIIVAGMGGSALGARLIDSLNFEVLDVPLEIVNGYHLPAYANRNSLVVISSYSGNTEETISCCFEAIRKKCQIFVIATGGKLGRLAQKKNLASYIFRPQYNPAKQPRLGLGYSIVAQLALLSKSGFIRLDESQITQTLNYLKKIKEKLSVSSLIEENPAKKIAFNFRDKIIVLVSSEHLNGATHAFKNMLNENSKTFSMRFSIPEMNHHLLEGLSFPHLNKRLLKFLFLESNLYDKEIKERIRITKEVIKGSKIPFEKMKVEGRTKLVQVFETIYLAGFISFYLAILNDINPEPIPWVDYFKKRIKK